MALSVPNLLANHFLLLADMFLVNLVLLGLLTPAILAKPHFVERRATSDNLELSTTEEAYNTTESTMTTEQESTDTTESSTVPEIIVIPAIGNETSVEGSTAIVIIPAEIFTNETTTEAETTTASMRKKRSVLEENSIENRDDNANSTETEETAAQSIEGSGDSVTESAETDDSGNSVTEEAPQEPSTEFLTLFTNRLPTVDVGVFPQPIGDSGVIIPLINRFPAPSTNGDTTSRDFNQEIVFNEENCDPQLTDKVNYENFQIPEDPDVYLFKTIISNFLEKLQNIVHELKAGKNIESHPSRSKDSFNLKIMLGFSENESHREISNK